MSKNNSANETGTMLVAFIAGALVGIGSAVLLTPKTGSQLRGEAKDLLDAAVDRIKGCAVEAQEKILSCRRDRQQ